MYLKERKRLPLSNYSSSPLIHNSLVGYGCFPSQEDIELLMEKKKKTLQILLQDVIGRWVSSYIVELMKTLHVGPFKTDGSRWRGLTKHGLLEKGMTNQFSFLAMRIS